MEIAKLLLKIIYLVFLYVALFVVIKPQIQLDGAKMNVVVLSLAVLLMYFTFDPVYDFTMNNEIVIKNDKKDKKDKKEKKSVKKEYVNKTKQEMSNDYLYDHTHKYIEDRVFQ